MKYCLGLLLCVLCTCSSPTEPDGEPLLFPSNFATMFQTVRDCRQSNAHDMHFISVAANVKAESLYREGRYPLPVGSILVKTLYDDPTCTAPVGYVAMRKDGNWVWQDATTNFEVRDTGALKSCIACHSACGDRDLTCTNP